MKIINKKKFLDDNIMLEVRNKVSRFCTESIKTIIWEYLQANERNISFNIARRIRFEVIDTLNRRY